MQTAMLVFDHVNKKVMQVSTAAPPDKKLKELLAAQRKQVATSGLPRH